MGIHKNGTFDRLEIVETGRRRRWSEDKKLRVVMESLSGPRLVAATARRHKISRSQLSAWRRAFRANAQGATADPVFVPAVISPLPTPGPVLARIADLPSSRLSELLPWNWPQPSARLAA